MNQVLIWKCIVRNCPNELNDVENNLNRKMCNTCRGKKWNYQRTKFVTKEGSVLYLLKGQKANMGMICSFINSSPQVARQTITNLRGKGYKIKLQNQEGYYELL